MVAFYTFWAGGLMSGPVAGWQYASEATGITITELNYGYAIAILFCGLGNIPWTVLANCYGRRQAYLICSFGCMLMGIWTAEYQTLGSYYAKQVFQGFFCAPFEGMTMTIVADLFFLHERGLYMALVFLHAVVGTDLGTIMSAYISSTGVLNWRWAGWVFAMAFGVSFLLFFFFFEETRFVRVASEPASISSSAAMDTFSSSQDTKEKDGTVDGATEIERGEIEAVQGPRTIKEKLALYDLPPNELRQSPWEVFKQCMVLFYYPAVVWAGCVYGINVAVYACVLSMLGPVIEVPPYNFTAQQLGLTRFGTITGTVIAIFISGPVSDWIANSMARRNRGVREAEHRLPLFLLGLITMPGCLLIFGLCAHYHTHWFGVVFGEALSSFSYTFTSELAMNYVVDCYRPVAIESFVGVVVIRNMFGFVLTFAISPWLAADGVMLVSIAMAVIAFAIYCSTFPLYYHGKRLRIWTSTRYPLAGRKNM